MKTKAKAEFTNKGELVQKLDLIGLAGFIGKDTVNAVKKQETGERTSNQGIQVNNG